MNDQVKLQIETLIKNNPVVLFMKGTKERPQCGFSKRVVEVLNNMSDFVGVDVLADPAIREGIKVYSSWPTIPQLYINQEFIGGCDIVLDLFEKQQLQKLLGLPKADKVPVINITPQALHAFKNAQADCGPNEHIRIGVGFDFEHALSFDEKKPEDFEIDFEGFSILLDPYSAVRASGLSIDYVETGLEAGFSFENPNEPPPVQELSVQELQTWHKQGKDVLVIDVRPQQEWDRAHINFARPLFEMDDQAIAHLQKDQTIVFHCHHGGRSRRMSEAWRKKGFKKIYNLAGGIDAWSRHIDSSVPIYE